VKLTEVAVDFETQVDMNRVSLDLLFPAISGQPIAQGELFAGGEFSAGQVTPEMFYQGIKGSGSVLINKATFFTVDLFQALAQLPSFSVFGSEVRGKTFFDDIRGHYLYENGKFISEDLVFLSPDFSIDGKGELTHEGVLNFRLDLYLSREQASKVLGESSSQMSLAAGEWFGPLPFLLTGRLDKPELRSDVELSVNLLNQVQRGEGQSAFRNFLREEALFEDFDKN